MASASDILPSSAACSATLGRKTRYGAIAIHLLGFLRLDGGNNIMQGSCRVLVAVLAVLSVVLCLKETSVSSFGCGAKRYERRLCMLLEGYIYNPLCMEHLGLVRIDEGVVFNVAGGLLLEHPLTLPFVEAVVGAVDSVMGLPKALTEKLLNEAPTDC